MKQTGTKSSDIIRILRIVSILVFIGVVIYALIYLRDTTTEDVLNYAPANLWLAAIFILVAYALKSLTVVVPIVILYIGAGVLFPTPIAIGINLIGIAIAVSIPYFLGRFFGMEMLDKILKKYPKAQQLNQLKTDNEFFFVYLVKLIGLIPCDVSSMALGAMQVRVHNMVLGSVIGMAPYMIAVTVLGANLKDPISTPFFVSFGIVIVLSVFSSLLYRFIMKRKKAKLKEEPYTQKEEDVI